MLGNYSLLYLLSMVIVSGGSVRFTKEPPRKVYVFKGRTARLAWEYHVDDRNKEFDINSPKWNFYTSKGTVLNIASEDMFQNWKWVIHRDTCPPRLLNPTRVFKESLATLIINNVTAADSGEYGCSLVLLRTSSPINSKVMLLVVENVEATTKLTTIKRPTLSTLKENTTDLPINSTEPRQPVLPLLKASHMINKSFSDNIVKSWNNKSLIIRCFVIGTARPHIIWYSPIGNDITNSSRLTKEGSQLSVITLQDTDYGIYTCLAKDIFGFDQHEINVTNSCICPTIKKRRKARALIENKHPSHKKSNPGLKHKKLYVVCLGIIGVSWVVSLFLILKF